MRNRFKNLSSVFKIRVLVIVSYTSYLSHTFIENNLFSNNVIKGYK